MLRSARSALYILFLATLVLVSGSVTGAAVLGDGVVVDPGSRVAYIATPEGGLQAVACGNGDTVWSAAGAKPLAAAGGLVIAQSTSSSEQLEVVSFDAANGNARGVKARVELPADVRATLNDGANASFRASASVDDGTVVVSWLARRTSPDDTMRGYLPAAGDPGAGASPLQQWDGSARLDLDSGAVAPMSGPAVVAQGLELLPATEVPGASGNLFASADGRHVLASEHMESDDPFKSYRWTIYERATGERLGELTSISSAAPFMVVDGSLLWVAPRSIGRKGKDLVDRPMSLNAVELASGNQLWSRQVNDPSFRGPFPP